MMGERAYTVAEIDQLRSACEMRWLWGTASFGTGRSGQVSRSYREEERAVGVEQLVRTYMLAGITAADIYAEDQASAARWQEQLASLEPSPPDINEPGT
jgi:hypothetical protein